VRGILLAGGAGSRLYPATKAVNKHLLPIFDKPMIYYSLSVLLLAGIRDILVICNQKDLAQYQDLMGDGSQWGISLQYCIQSAPRGIADAFILAEDFIGGGNVCLVLGDNIFYGSSLIKILQKAAQLERGAKIFGYYVRDPERYGIIEFDALGKPLSLEEKPRKPKSNYAVTGLYFYDCKVVEYAKQLEPSARGELEITDINQKYLQQQTLEVEIFGRGIAWLDTGTHESLLKASNFVESIESRQGLKISCLEEIALYQGWISSQNVFDLADQMGTTQYAGYLRMIATSKNQQIKGPHD
jgi:glucose-1-phosphate thymidylyltransferase